MHSFTATLARRPLSASLAKRSAIEAEFERTGKTFRRHPGRSEAERLFIKPLLKLGLGMTGIYARGVRNALQPVVRHLKLQFPNLPAAFHGYKVLHLADLHIDSVEGLPEVVSSMVARLKPDLCLMTGDYRFEIEGSCEKAYAGMKQVVSAISAPDGIFAILGNHDPCEMAYGLDQMRVHMLINDAVEVRRAGQSLWLAGVDDTYDYRCDDLAAALSAMPQNAFEILLAHTPDLFAQAARAGVDLYLCGHTHAGQVRLPFVGSVIQNSDAPRGFTHGHWRHHQMQGFTSAGVGCSMLPIRFNCPPEIVLIELQATASVRNQ